MIGQTIVEMIGQTIVEMIGQTIVEMIGQTIVEIIFAFEKNACKQMNWPRFLCRIP
jgi:hypothetical protein